MRKILFVVNRTKPEAQRIADRLARAARGAGMDVGICGDFPVPDSAFDGADICCVVGGDGTILSCVRAAADFGIPIFGINLGKLGFLAHYSDSIDDASFLTLAAGEGRILERELLEARIGGNAFVALNDFAVKSSGAAAVSGLGISADGEFIANYVGDGLVFSTPTGSTAYNLSAGGPLIHPKAKVFVMTPVCPHTLSNRSLVYDASAKIGISCLSGDCVFVSDGRIVSDFPRGSQAEVFISSKTVKFSRLRGHSHFSILRSKLGWAEDLRHLRQ